METKEYFEKVQCRTLTRTVEVKTSVSIVVMKESTTKWLYEYKKQYSSSKGKVEKEEEPSLIPLQVIDERFSEQPVVQPEAKWCVKRLVIASPTGNRVGDKMFKLGGCCRTAA